jgi:hypothetical protein
MHLMTVGSTQIRCGGCRRDLARLVREGCVGEAGLNTASPIGGNLDLVVSQDLGEGFLDGVQRVLRQNSNN